MSGEDVHAEGIFDAQHRRLTIGVLSLVVMVAFEAMAVATAMPAAARELRGLAAYSWAFTGFLTASLFAMATAGDLCDRLGPRRPLIAGVALFAVGLMVAGSAPTMAAFVVGRVVQGLGGGTAIVALYVAVGGYPDALRPKVFSALSACWVLPSVVGPPVAGILTEQLSWRWVFWGLLPVVAAPLWLILPSLTGAGSRSARAPGRVLLALALAVGVAVVQYSGLLVADAARDRDWFAVVALALVGLGAAIPALRGFVPAGTLRLRSGLPSVVATRGFLAGGFFGAEAFLPLMLVEHRGWSVTLAGMSLTGAALGWSTGSWLMGGRAPRSDAAGRRARAGRFAARGAAVAAAGVAATGLVSIDTAALTVPSALAPVAWVLTGLGMGMAMSSLSVLLFELSPVEERGANSAALQISDAVGSIAVIALAGVVYATSQAHGSTSGAAVGQGADAGSAVFAGVYAITLLVAVGAAVVATRVLPRSVRAPERVVTAGGPPA